MSAFGSGRPPGAFYLEVTPLGWRLMGFYALVFGCVALFDGSGAGVSAEELRAQELFGLAEAPPSLPFWHALLLHPPGGPAALIPGSAGFQFWQPFTAPFVYPPGSFANLALAFIGFAFFAAPVERFYGPRRFLVFWAICSLGAGLGGFLFGPLLQPAGVHFGCGPVVLAVVLVHCLITPEAMVTFFLMLPVRMKWIAGGLALWVLIKALAMTSPLGTGNAAGGYELGAVLTGYLWFRYGEGMLARRRRRKKAGELLKVVLQEVEGNGDSSDPTYH
ncbi:MAG: hypothetical protein CMP23_07525 [Rickettsiales bacterium]|nr:hypothetical protein [Rickettsiales bacterium]